MAAGKRKIKTVANAEDPLAFISTVKSEIKRNDSLIVLTTKSRDAAFVSAKLGAVVDAYLGLKAEADAARTAVRLEELRTREADLVARLAALRASQLEIGGEFGSDAIIKAHVEKKPK